ncbi:MAG: hypothetical protein NTX60_00075 [Actinobacteria bacterium]|nr:hypothetical protein [Actinomycetota bacterium]
MKKSDSVPKWTFLSNHGHVLVHLHNHPDSRVRDIAEFVGITEAQKPIGLLLKIFTEK